MSGSGRKDDFARPDFDGSRFENPRSFTNWTGLPGIRAILRWKFSEPQRLPIDPEELPRTLPVRKRPQLPEGSSLAATWLGHATVLARLDEVTFITDPVFADRASPFWFFGPKRFRPPPLTVDELPKLDLVVVSHDHYDHLDYDAVKRIGERNPDIHWFVPEGMKRWFDESGIAGHVTEMNWGDNQEVEIRGTKLQIWCVPAQHWGRRGLFDRNKRLWSGWAVVGPTKRFYYTGDTGYCDEEFEKLGKKLGPFDLAAIPIGCYAPRWFMFPQHIGPEEVVKIHEMVHARTSIGIHWGTYLMGSTEPYMEPKELLEKLAGDKNLSGAVITLEHGQVWTVEKGKLDGASTASSLKSATVTTNTTKESSKLI